MRIAIVTGTSSGIGLHTTIELAKQQYKVIALMRDQSNSDELDSQLALHSVANQVEQIRLNMEDIEEVKHTINYIFNKYKSIDVLVNNAGYAQGGLVELVDYEAWINQFQVNVWITINLCKAVVPIMRKQRNGRIINMGSVSGRLGLPAFAPYAMSKFAIAGFSEALRLELLPFKVYVSLIEAGSYQTDIWSKGFSTLPANTIQDYDHHYTRMLSLVEQSAKTKRHPQLIAQLIAKTIKKNRPTFRIIPTLDIKLIIFFKSILQWKYFEFIVMNYVLKLNKK